MSYQSQFERGRIKALRDDRIYIQQKTFTNWANSFLLKPRSEIKDLFADLADGKILMRLLEIISGKIIGKPNKGASRVHKCENVNRCLEFLLRNGACFENIGAEDIVDGNPRLILGLIWTIILRFELQEITFVVDDETTEKKAAKEALLLWCKRKTAGYAGINITNFTTSWRNGLALNAIIHSHRPDLIDYDALDQEDFVGNLNNSFIIAAEKFGIPKILDAEDVDLIISDEKSILTYVASYYHYFTKMESEMTGRNTTDNIFPGNLIPQEKRNSLESGAVVEEQFDIPQEVKVERKRTADMTKTMASSCNDICTPCQDYDDDVRQAVTRCTACDVFLCPECEYHHRKLPLSKLHKVISTEDYHKLPTFIKEIRNQCIYHNQKFELYCSFHGCPCCIQCFSEHQKCHNMRSLSDFLSQNEPSASVHFLEKDLINVVEKTEIVLNYLKRRKLINRMQRNQVIGKIRQTMESFNDHLNTLEKDCIGVLESRYCNLESNMSPLVEQIKRRSDKLRKLHKDFSNMLQFATGLHIFISLKEVEKITNEAAKYIDDLVSGGQLNESNIEIKISCVLQSLIQRVKSFGEIVITTSPSTIQLNRCNTDNLSYDMIETVSRSWQIDEEILSNKPTIITVYHRIIKYEECGDDRRYCRPCRDDENVLNPAAKWCTECDAFLCLKCEKEHRKNPSSKHHEIMSAKEYSQLPAFVKTLSYQCKDHNLTFNLYCSFHDSLCCSQCLYKHKSCQDIKPLSDTLLNIRSSAALDFAEEDFINVEENFELILNYLKTRIEENNNQKIKAIEKVQSTRKSIDNHLNMLEQQILEDIESNQTSLISNIDTLLTQVDNRSGEIRNLHAEISKITQVATELQLYIGLEEINKQTSEATQYIEDLKRGGHLNEHDLGIELSADVQSILDDVESFGDINITNNLCSVKVKAGRKNQPKHFVHIVPNIEQIKPSLLRTLTVPDEIRPIDVNACRILPDGKFFILNQYQNQLLLFTHDGIFIRIVVTLNERVNDVCLVRNNIVAVAFTTSKSNQTALFDIEKNEIKNTIELSHDCSSVTSDGQILVISGVCTKNSTIVNLDDMTHKNFEGVWGNRISLFKENIYCTDYKGGNIRCYERTGTLLWKFVHNEISYPSGLALDINGFVYITSLENNTIAVVSPDGKTGRTIKSNDDGVINPTGIDLNRDTGIMIVSCQASNDKPRILLFKI